MNYQEITELHSRLEARMADRDTTKDDLSISQLAESQGWNVLRGIMESMIAELLEREDFDDSVPLDVRGSIGDAKKFGIDVLRKTIGIVESTKAAKRVEQIEKAQAEESEPVA